MRFRMLLLAILKESVVIIATVAAVAAVFAWPGISPVIASVIAVAVVILAVAAITLAFKPFTPEKGLLMSCTPASKCCA